MHIPEVNLAIKKYIYLIVIIFYMANYTLTLGVNGTLSMECDETFSEDDILNMLSEDTVKLAFSSTEALTGDALQNLRTAIEKDLTAKGFKNFNWK